MVNNPRQQQEEAEGFSTAGAFGVGAAIGAAQHVVTRLILVGLSAIASRLSKKKEQ